MSEVTVYVVRAVSMFAPNSQSARLAGSESKMERVVLAADHDRDVAEAEARGRAKGLEDAERAVRGLHIAVWSTIETGPEHACEDRSECDALERAERAIAALRKPEVEG